MEKRLGIIGGGESGTGAAILAKKAGWEVFLSDGGALKEVYRKRLTENQIQFEEGSHNREILANCTLIVKSPGIPEKAEIIRFLRQNGLSVISEIEFAFTFCKGQITAITGSNGKTTTSSLVHHIYSRAGLDCCLAGNVGNSFAGELAKGDHDHFVLELSSFQLDDIETFRPKVAILLNITPDHLDRYNYNLEEYAESKYRITENQTESDFLIFNADDSIIVELLKKKPPKARAIPFSIQGDTGEEGGFLEKDQIIVRINQTTFNMPVSDISIIGKHNIYNSLAASVSARAFDLRKEIIRECLTDFKSIEHRLEHVARVRGVDYINDSKATNVNSVWYALESMTKPVVWIVGGVDKGNDYNILIPLVRQKVKAIVCLGKENLRIHEAFSRHVGIIVNTGSAQEAVQNAYYLAKSGDAVLLSPACASFDLFQNYEDRGNQFKEAVRKL